MTCETCAKPYIEADWSHCAECHRTWRAAQATCHCADCHRHFGSNGAFDAHLAGPVTARRCVEPRADHGYYWDDEDRTWRTRYDGPRANAHGKGGASRAGGAEDANGCQEPSDAETGQFAPSGSAR